MDESYAWVPYVFIPLIIVLVVAGNWLINRSAVRCPNCRKYNSYTVIRKKVEGTEGWSDYDHERERPTGYKLAQFDSAYTCTACDYVWEKRESLRV